MNFLHVIFACLLVYLCIIFLKNYLLLFPNFSYFNLTPLYLSVILTILGVSIGAIVYKISLSKRLPSGYKSKDYMIMAFEIIIVTLLISIYLTYALVENNLEKAVYFVFTVIGMPILFIMVPVISIYSILKKELKIFILSGINFLSFYIFIIIAEGLIDGSRKFSPVNYHETLLFFIIFMILIELGLRIISFESIIERITQDRQYINKKLIAGFNRVFNKYILVLFTFILLSYFITQFFVQIESFSIILENFGLQMGSIQSIILFTGLAILITLFFWFYGPKEKRNIFRILKNIIKIKPKKNDS